MKKLLIYFAVCAAIVVTGCTDFGKENQLTLPAAPAIGISNIVAEAGGDSITFTVAPSGTAGAYSWVVIQSDVADPNMQADKVLKKQVSGVASGVVLYSDATKSKTVGVGNLTPYTVYQIYAVASSPDGIVGVVQNANIRTADDGSLPRPSTVAIAGGTVTLTFSEPLQLGTGKVYVSYFAKNTLSGPKLTINSGFESFNPQDIAIPSDSLTINGSALIINLPDPPAGAYASITYEGGALRDLIGNGCNAYTAKADTLVSGAPSRGITVHVANKSWALYSEFEDPDEVKTFAVWDELVIPALPDEGITVSKKVATIIPTVVYNEPGKTTKIEVTTWGTISGTPAFMLPEEPARGATVDLNVPAGAYEDVYGNTSLSLSIVGQYLYSYGYTLADVVGTYNIAMTSYWDGPATETSIVIEAASANDDNALLIKNLFDTDTKIEGTLDPVSGTITLDDEQLLESGVDFGDGELYSVLFVNADDSAPVVFNVPSPGKITSPAQWWGYYVINDNDDSDQGWYDVFTESTWTRTSTSNSIPAVLKASAVKKTIKHSIVKHGERILHK